MNVVEDCESTLVRIKLMTVGGQTTFDPNIILTRMHPCQSIMEMLIN